jgi:hypothetical protein
VTYPVRERVKGTNTQHFIVCCLFFTFLWHHSIKYKAEIQNFKNFKKVNVKSSPKSDFCEYRIIVKNAPFYFAFSSKTLGFHSAYSLKVHNSTSSLNTLYTAESAQFSSTFLPTTISLTPHFCWKCEVWLHIFAKNAQNGPITHSYEDNAKFHSTFLATTLNYATCFWRKREVIENIKYLGDYEEDFWKCWLYCDLYLLVIERCKKRLKTD